MGDYTRSTFKPRKGYTAVLQQQGRVSLDADHNEAADIDDRRHRSTTMDTIGRCAVPAKTTPTAFEIQAAGASLTIGSGRAYVDGIQIECGGEIPGYDRSLGEDRGVDPLPFDEQPFRYEPDFPSLEAAGGHGIAYVDVWRREVTVIEDPDLREPALGGPDTTTRRQTAWQVKVLVDESVAACEDASDAWTALTVWEPGRLSTATPDAPPEPSPCVINPLDGYTGLENRLYRVEIHTGGQAGDPDPPQFKWSRDNASLTVPVESVTAVGTESDLKLAHTGYDQWRRFEVDQHIELLDDHVEWAAFDQGRGGLMARIVAVDLAKATIRVDQDLSAFAIDPARHPRVRRWDSAPGQTVLRDIELGTGLALEDGIVITFKDDPAAVFHAGDYWIFHARTATGSIEELDEAPPHGPIHHFCKLAVVTPNGIDDCRELWPPEVERPEPIPGEGCCTVVVHPGESIQEAVDAVAHGGCVCLKAGVHRIQEPIFVHHPNLVLHGESLAAHVVGRTRKLLIIERAQDVEVHTIRFETIGGAPDEEDPLADAAVVIRRSEGVILRDCVVEAERNRETAGVLVFDSRAVRVERNAIAGVLTAVVGRNDCEQLSIHENDIRGVIDDEVDFGVAAVDLQNVLGFCRVTSNRIDGFVEGIRVDVAKGENQGPLIAGNRIYRSHPADVESAWGIRVVATGAVVRDNAIDVMSPSHGGILCTGARSWIEGNIIESSTGQGEGGSGIELRTGEVLDDDGAIRANRLFKVASGIILRGTRGVEVSDNDVRGGRLAIGLVLIRTSATRVVGNRIDGAEQGVVIRSCVTTTVEANWLTNGGVGIFAERTLELNVTDNEIEDMAEFGILSSSQMAPVTVSNNRLRRCAQLEKDAASIALILIEGTGADAVVEHNHVLDAGVSRDGGTTGFSVGIQVVADHARVHGNHVGHSGRPELEFRALVLEGANPNGVEDGWALVLNNTFVGSASERFALVEVGNRGDSERFSPRRVSFSNNYCEQRPLHGGDGRAAVVVLRGERVLVQGNHVVSVQQTSSFAFHAEAVVFLGNICDTQPLLPLPPLTPVAMLDFNQIG